MSIETTDTPSDEIDLEAILLRVTDLPDGWSELSVGPFLVAWVVGEPPSDALAEINDVVVACDGTTAPSENNRKPSGGNHQARC